jgi:hypothetical protein
VKPDHDDQLSRSVQNETPTCGVRVGWSKSQSAPPKTETLKPSPMTQFSSAPTVRPGEAKLNIVEKVAK